MQGRCGKKLAKCVVVQWYRVWPFQSKTPIKLDVFHWLHIWMRKKEERGVVGSIDFSNIIGRITGHSQTIRVSKSLRICRHCFSIDSYIHTGCSIRRLSNWLNTRGAHSQINSSDLAGWLIFWTTFHKDFKNVNFIKVRHTPSTHNFCPRSPRTGSASGYVGRVGASTGFVWSKN